MNVSANLLQSLGCHVAGGSATHHANRTTEQSDCGSNRRPGDFATALDEFNREDLVIIFPLLTHVGDRIEGWYALCV